MEMFEYRNLSLSAWDVGGQSLMRRYWNQYYPNTHALIFVVDSSDRVRIAQARDELLAMLREDDLSQSLLLVLANKQVNRIPYTLDNTFMNSFHF